jgi:hypothetical protein
MKSLATARFWRCFDALPKNIQQQAENARAWQADPNRPSLDFKQVHASRPIVSVRIGLHYRAIGQRDGDTVVWFWIGSHADYDNLLRRL